jgi:hypothetical protein
MKPTQTLVEAQNQLFASICSLVEQMTYHAHPAHCNTDKDILAKAQQNFLNAVRGYAETLVYDTYSRYDPYDGGEFLTHEAYEEILKSLEDDEVIPMEDVAKELGIKW